MRWLQLEIKVSDSIPTDIIETLPNDEFCVPHTARNLAFLPQLTQYSANILTVALHYKINIARHPTTVAWIFQKIKNRGNEGKRACESAHGDILSVEFSECGITCKFDQIFNETLTRPKGLTRYLWTNSFKFLQFSREKAKFPTLPRIKRIHRKNAPILRKQWTPYRNNQLLASYMSQQMCDDLPRPSDVRQLALQYKNIITHCPHTMGWQEMHTGWL